MTLARALAIDCSLKSTIFFIGYYPQSTSSSIKTVSHGSTIEQEIHAFYGYSNKHSIGKIPDESIVRFRTQETSLFVTKIKLLVHDPNMMNTEEARLYTQRRQGRKNRCLYFSISSGCSSMRNMVRWQKTIYYLWQPQVLFHKQQLKVSLQINRDYKTSLFATKIKLLMHDPSMMNTEKVLPYTRRRQGRK